MSRLIDELPSALGCFSEIHEWIRSQNCILFLDYDGTLTPIVSHPQDAFLSSSMRRVLMSLSKIFKVAIISGRDLKDLKDHIGIEELFYAGSHGYDISGPGNLHREYPEAEAMIPLLNQAEQKMRRLVPLFQNAYLERKRYSVALHYRNISTNEKEAFINTVKEISQQFDRLKLTYGKKVMELHPHLDWDKGKALLWITNYLNENNFRLYVGDDLTDEDAFRVLRNRGVSIVVGEERRESLAKYSLKDPHEVQKFLENLVEG